VFTLSQPGVLGALATHPCIKKVCGDNLVNWNWPELFDYKEASEFDNIETWDFASDAVGSLGTVFNVSGSVNYGDGLSFDSASSYLWLNLSTANRHEGVAQFEIEWTPTNANQRIFHIGPYNDGGGFAASKDKLGFYVGGAWHWLDYPNVSSGTETHTVKVYWNDFTYMVYVDGKAVGSSTLNFSTVTNNTGKNFCFGSNSTGFLGKIRNLQMWY
jgi:hypothetical protein